MKAHLPKRKPDKYGSGEYGASRSGGTRTHNGIDYTCPVDALIYPHVSGFVTKHGWPYAGRHLRYIEVETPDNYYLRYFYVLPIAGIGFFVTPDDAIGKCQSLQSVHPGITDHVHFEIKKDGEYINPEEWLESL